MTGWVPDVGPPGERGARGDRGASRPGERGVQGATSPGQHSGPAIGVALKLTPRRVEVDQVTGDATPDRAPAGPSAAGLAALEIALRLRDAWHSQVTVVTVGTSAAEPMLRDALARGADNAIRIQAPPESAVEAPGMPYALGAAADALAGVLAGHQVVLCGDGGHGSGTGAVPALLAARTGWAQALGLTSVDPAREPGVVRAERRLDRGWREWLIVRAPMVLSVESVIARPRRASLDAVLAARGAPVAVVSATAADGDSRTHGAALTVQPYRPRARVLTVPAGDSPLARVLSMLGGDGGREPPERVDAEPAAAAQRIVGKLRDWGYL
jgi:electron transfer flavoprotein beta subunit